MIRFASSWIRRFAGGSVSLSIAVSAAGGELGPDSVVGTAAGEPVRLREVDTRSKGAVTSLQEDLREAKRAAIDRIVEKMLLADEVVATPEPSPEQVSRLVSLLPSSEAADAARPFARDLLARELLRRARSERAAELRASRGVEVLSMATSAGVVARIPPSGDAPARSVRAAEVEEAASLRLFTIRGRIVEEAGRLFAVIADDRLLAREAKRRGASPEELIGSVEGVAEPVSDEVVRAYWEEHRAELGEFRPERIRPWLEFRSRYQPREELLAKLRASDPPRFLLKAPAPPRFATPPPGPGEAGDSAVALVVFSNFRCQRCEDSERVLDEVLAGPHGARVRVERAHLFPAAALPAYLDAVAAVCAERGGFDDRFRAALRAALPAREADAAEIGRGVAPDAESFERCRRERETRSQALSGLDRARRIGFREAPAFLVNGLPLAGFQGRARLEEMIGREAQASTGKQAKGSTGVVTPE